MASITSLTNSSGSTSNLYGNRNVISGLASGMDTESMIANSVSGYKTKITSLQQQMTQLQWKQDAYRSLISQMSSMLNKYTSYTSSTNLAGSAFFNSAVKTIANGANAGKVSATGRSTSDVAINAIKQMATAASYSVGTSNLVSNASKTTEMQLDGSVDVSKASGSLSFQIGGLGGTGGTSFTIRFAEDEVYNSPEELKDAINKKLSEKNVTSSSGTTHTADYYMKAEVVGGKIKFVDNNSGNGLRMTGGSGDIAELFKQTVKDPATGDENVTYSMESKDITKDDLVESKTAEEYLAGKTINVTLNGKTVKFKFDDIFADADYNQTEDFATVLNKKISDQFGAGKVNVSIDSNGALTFDGVAKGTTFKVNGSNSKVNEILGLGEGGYSNTMQTGWSMEKALGDAVNWQVKHAVDADGNEIVDMYIDKNGKETANENEAVKVSTLTINGKDFEIKSTDTIQNVMDKINGNSKAGVTVKFSALTGRFSITSKETGESQGITIGGDAGKALFGEVENGVPATSSGKDDPKYSAGQDAIFDVTVNGQQMQLRRSSNTVDLDGLKVTLNSTFGNYNEVTDPSDPTKKKYERIEDGTEAITFTTQSDSDKIVDAIKSFVEDYNKLVTELHNAYSTLPLQDSSGNEYKPLSEEEAAKNTESYNKSYEEKAKTGLLFGDSDLSNLYTKLTSAVQGTGEVGRAMRSIGLEVNYARDGGLSTITLDETKLREALESDPDKVKNAFTQTTANGASVNGIMTNLKSTLEQYGSTSIANPGILVSKAGTTLSSYSLTHNELNDQINNLQTEIDKWQDKMGDKIDFYTNQFTQLELLINQMNSQSSMLAGLTGGY